MRQLNLILLDGPSLISCSFSKKESVKPGEDANILCSYSLSMIINEKEDLVDVTFSAESNSEFLPFDFIAMANASFKSETIDTKKHKKAAIQKQINFESVPFLFLFLRELIADITRKAGFKPFYLPSIDLKAGSVITKKQEQ
ncbi:MAG: protein-export chaperone SecB [Desulfuromusa sp.]